MANVNLMPWRMLKREHKKKRFFIFLSIHVITAIAIIFFSYIYLLNLLENQAHRNLWLKNEIAGLESQVREIGEIKGLRRALLVRLNWIKKMQTSRSVLIFLLNELSRVIPTSLFFTRIERHENKVTLSGYTESNQDVSQFMRQIELISWMRKPKLAEVKKTHPNVGHEFKLSFILASKSLISYNRHDEKI